MTETRPVRAWPWRRVCFAIAFIFQAIVFAAFAVHITMRNTNACQASGFGRVNRLGWWI